ncbi:MAG: GTP-binding protein [Rhodospirillales bacterium]
MSENSVPLEEPLPVTVLTGFLGSGKTTLLRQLIAAPGGERLAIIVNEFGEIALDHHLLRSIDESTMVLDGGCLCCSVRDDLVNGLCDLASKRSRGEVPPFTRVVIETTGLADPAPILHTLIRDRLVAFFYRLDGVVATLDAVNAAALLRNELEAAKQAAMADRLLITKPDLATTDVLETLEREVKRLNPAAPLHRVLQGAIDPALLFNAGLYDAESKSLQARRWLAAEAYEAEAADRSHDHGHDHHHSHDHDHAGHHDHHRHAVETRHDSGIEAFCITRDEPLDWDRLSTWIETMILTHGDKLLRVKGLVNARGESAPIALHGVQHLFHPPILLEAWPDLDRRTRLVFIARDMDRATLERSLDAFVG